MKKIWFVSSQRNIRGPITSDELEQSLELGNLTADNMVWWKGQSQWITISTWQAQLPLHNMVLDTDQKPEVWRFEYRGTKHGPMNIDQMIQVIQKNPDINEFKISMLGSDDWVGVFSSREVLGAMGLSRRRHTRVPITGVTNIQMPYDHMIAEAATISEGGFGVTEGFLPVGHIVEFQLKSPVLPSIVRSKAEVLYTLADGFSGLKFQKLHVESHSLILDYIKKFSKAS